MKAFKKRLVTIPPNSIATEEFDGQNPNYFRIANNGGATVYVGFTSLPNKNFYDFKVEPKQTRMYCEEYGYPKMYIYNSSGSPISIILYTFSAPYDPVVMSLTDFNIAENEEQTVQVEIGAFTESLPQGANHIGGVNVDNMPTDYAKEALQKDYTTALTNILNAIGNISGGGTSVWTTEDVSSILSFIETAKNIKYKTPTCVKRENITSSLSCDGKEIKLLTNDGETDMKVTFGSQNFILKAGESITDMYIGQTFSIGANTSGETYTCRIIYV